MTDSNSKARPPLPKGVALLPKPRWGRQYLATIRKGKGVIIHLGLYETPWLAATAHDYAAELLHKARPPLRIPRDEEPAAEEVFLIRERVRRRLGIDVNTRSVNETPPSARDILTLFEVTVVPFWRTEAQNDHGGRPGSGLEAAAARLAESAQVLFWARSAGHPTPLEAMTQLLSRRLELAFRRSDLTRAVLDDEGDDLLGVARWLVYPNEANGSYPLFQEHVRTLYSDVLDANSASGERPEWAVRLALNPPFNAQRVRAAFLTLSRTDHPDAGGTDEAFVSLREAYEEGLEYCRWQS